MERIIPLIIYLSILVSCISNNNNSDIDYNQDAEELDIDSLVKPCGMLYEYNIESIIPQKVIDSIFSVFQSITVVDSINLITIMKYDFKEVLTDTNVCLMDSLIALYDFKMEPSSYSHKISIPLSKDLVMNYFFAGTHIYRYKEFEVKDIFQIDVTFHDQVVFGVDPMSRDSINLILPIEINWLSNFEITPIRPKYCPHFT